MATFGSKVVAVLDTTSAFGVTIKQLKESVDSHTAQLSTLLGDAPEALDTLNEIAAALGDDPAFFSSMATANATLQTNIDNLTTAAATARTNLQTLLQGNIDGVATDLTTETTARGVAIAALQADVDQNESDADAAIALRAPIDGPAFTGNLITHIGSATAPVVHRIQGGFPDILLRTNGADVATDQNEGRLLWEDAGGGGVGAIKQTMLPTAPMRFFVGGITASEERMRILANGRVGIGTTSPAAQLHVAGSALVQADYPDFQMRSGGEKRLIFEDNGGGALAAIKCAGAHMKLFAGGVGGSDQIAEVNATGLTITAGKSLTLEGTAVTATGAELNQLDGVTLGTAASAATGDFATAAQGALADSALQAADVSGKADLSGASFTGNVDIAKSFPDLQFKSGDEQRILFADGGGSANGGIKFVSNTMKFFAGGIASGNQILSFDADSIDIEQDVILNDERVYFNSGSQLIRLKDNQTSALKIQNHDGSTLEFLDFKTANSGEQLIFGAPNQFNSTITVGEDDTGYDVKFFGATASAYMLWDESADDLILAGDAGLVVPEGQLTIGATAVTATGAELNYVDGVTSSIQGQLNTLSALTTVHGGLLNATAGTVSAQVAVIPDASKDITGFRDLTASRRVTAASVVFSGGLSDYADDTAAAAGGIAVGQLYRTGSAVKIRVS